MTPTPEDVLRDSFGLDSFRPGQRAIIDRLLAGRSVLAVLPTGAGKSLCYQLPALLIEGLTLVVSPLIALMKDQVDALVKRGIPAARLDSTLEGKEVAEIHDRLATGALRILYVAPERLSSERFVARLRKLRIGLLAIDEAHCISEWGHNFRPDYLKLAKTARDLRVGRVLALTATATPSVAADVRRAFGIADEDHVQTGFHRPNLDLRVTPCAADDRSRVLLARLRESGDGATIVYVTLQRTAEQVAEFLAKNGVSARAYHAGLEADERTAVQDAFMRGDVRVVVATIAFGMGIDKSDIRAVYHYNVPKTLENYVQEVGRAGRDGLPSHCEVLACGDDRTVLENFTYGDTPVRESIDRLVASLVDREGSDAERFSISLYDLSNEHDIRPLVVSTALTYLELDGTLAHLGPFYSEYKLRFDRPAAKIVERFDAKRAAFLRAVFAAGKKGRTWLTVVLDDVAASLGEPRERIVAALEYLQDQGDLAVQVSGLRHAYRIVKRPDDRGALVERLCLLFCKREDRDLERLALVYRFLESDRCLARELLAYFGEDLPQDCGRCSSCSGERPRKVPASPVRALGDRDAPLVRELRAEGHAALANPRALARFLCGLTSPATTRARLGRDPRFGTFGEVRFADVLTFVSA